MGAVTSRSTDEAEQLAAHYRELDGALAPLRTMLATPADQFETSPDAVEADDAPVIAAFDDLRPLAQQTVEWMEWAADHVWRQERDVGEDEPSLHAALTEITEVRDAARELAGQAVPALDVGQRAALARYLLVELDILDKLWGPKGKHRDDPTPAANLDHFVDQQLEGFFHQSKFSAWTAKRSSTAARLFGPKVARGPIPWRMVGSKQPRLRRWRDLHQPMQRIQVYGGEIEGSYDRVRHAHAEAQRVEHRAAQERREREREEEARRRAAEAERLAQLIADLIERFEAFQAQWALSSSRLRRRGWTGLQKALCDGTYDADGVLTVPGIPREEARAVLALLQLAAEHGPRTGERLGELLATEDALLDERARLQNDIAGLPVHADLASKLADLHPHLREAYEWLAAHLDQVTSVLAEHAPHDARTLHDATRQVRGDATS